MSVTVYMMQPAFLPWQGFFELIDKSDVFVVCDDFQFVKQSWHQRNRLFVSRNRTDWYTVPVGTVSGSRAPLNSVMVDDSERWRERMWRRIEYNYRGTPHFREIAGPVSEWLFSRSSSLADFNVGFIRLACRLMGIETEFRLSSQRPGTERRSQRVLDLLRWCGATKYLCAGGSFDYMAEDEVFPVPDIEVLFQDFNPAPYPQVCAPGNFVPSLSVLDALLNVGAEATCELIRKGTSQFICWEMRRRPVVCLHSSYHQQ